MYEETRTRTRKKDSVKFSSCLLSPLDPLSSLTSFFKVSCECNRLPDSDYTSLCFESVLVVPWNGIANRRQLTLSLTSIHSVSQAFKWHHRVFFFVRDSILTLLLTRSSRIFSLTLMDSSLVWSLVQFSIPFSVPLITLRLHLSCSSFLSCLFCFLRLH